MTNALTDVRARLKTVLDAAELDAHAVVPPKVTPPCTFVAPGSPYVTREGATFGGEIVRCSVVVVAAAATNETTAEDLDGMVLRTLDALDVLEVEDFTVTDVGQPGQILLNGQTYLGASIEVQTEIRRSRP